MKTLLIKTALCLLVALCLSSLAGCQDEDDPVMMETPFIPINLNYREVIGQGVGYEYNVAISPLVYDNDSDVPVTVTVDPFPDETVTVGWSSDDPQAFGWEGSEGLYLYRPITLYDMPTGYILVDTNEKLKVPYRQGKYTYPCDIVDEETLTVSPRSRLTLQGSVTYHYLETAYLLTIRRKYPEETRTIEGTIIYECPYKRNITVSETPLP